MKKPRQVPLPPAASHLVTFFGLPTTTPGSTSLWVDRRPARPSMLAILQVGGNTDLTRKPRRFDPSWARGSNTGATLTRNSLVLMQFFLLSWTVSGACPQMAQMTFDP